MSSESNELPGAMHKMPDLEGRLIIDLPEQLEFLQEVLVQVKIAVPWMVKTLRHATDELHEGNYSDELKHAISVKELLEKI